MAAPNENLSPARDIEIDLLSTRADVVSGLEQLHALVLEVCPDCLLKARGPVDGGFIYVPPERAHKTTHKNLLTVWPEASGVRMRIMPDAEEHFDAKKTASYRSRLQRLYGELLARN